MKLKTSQPSRRGLLRGAAGVGAAVAGFPMLNFGAYQAFADSPTKYSGRAVGLVERSLVIDMLGVLAMDDHDPLFASKLTPAKAQEFRSSGINVFHNSFGLGGPNAYADVAVYMAAWQGFVARNADLFFLVDKAADLDRAKPEKKIAVITGVQNAEHFRTPADVKMFYDLGQRCAQLTYNSQTLIGSGATERVDGGVSDFGASIIAAMNAAGMLVDVSHCGDRTTLDAIDISKGPIAFTHSNCRALNNHPRLKTDEAIKKLAAKGGVMGITGVRNFVWPTEPTTIDNIVDHIDHVAKLVGIEHVGVGTDSDLNGDDDMAPAIRAQLLAYYKSSYAFRDKLDIEGFDHPKKIYDLTEAMIRRGYSDANIQAVLGGNFRRLLGIVWA